MGDKEGAKGGKGDAGNAKVKEDGAVKSVAKEGEAAEVSEDVKDGDKGECKGKVKEEESDGQKDCG